MNRFSRKLLLTGLTAAAFFRFESEGDEAWEKETPPPPIRALLVTGGASHDYGTRKEIIVQGIRERLRRPVEWVVRFQGDGESDVRIPLFEETGWAGGYDIVVHDYCFPRVKDSTYIDRILAPHRAGLPAVLIHGTMHSFRTGDDRWFDFCGATSPRHGKPLDYQVEAAPGRNPLVAGMQPWSIPGGELYRIERLHEGATALTFSKDEQGKAETTSWTHLYGPARARVFATTLGNETSTLIEPDFLDLLARGFLWAFGETDEAGFIKVAPGNSLSRLSLAPVKAPLPKPGPSQVSRGRASAMSGAAGDLFGAENAIDGDPATYWEAGMAGPTSWQVEMSPAKAVGAILLTWKTEAPPRVRIEASPDQLKWKTLFDGEGRGAEPITVGFDPYLIRYLRVTIPETRPGEFPAIREVAAYGTMDLLPAAFPDFLTINGSPRVDLATAGTSGAAREVRLAGGWNLGATGLFPGGMRIVDLIPAASGKSYVLAECGEKRERAVFLATPPAKGEVEFREVLGQLAPETAVTWDGEWIYTLHGAELNAYRDTDGDGAIDDRSRVGRLFSLDKRSSPSPVTFTSFRAGPDGWFYAILSSTGDLTGFNAGHDPLQLPRHGLVRFRGNGKGLHVVAISPEPVSDYYFGSEGAIFTRHAGDLEPVIRPLAPLAGSAWRSLPALAWPPAAGEPRWKKLDLITHRDRIHALGQEGTPAVVAEVKGLKTIADDGSRIWFVKEEGDRDLVGVVTGPPYTPVTGLNWDAIAAPALFPHLDSPVRSIRTEAVYEILRRKYRPEKELGKMLHSDLRAPATEGVLAALSGTGGNRSLALLVEAAASPASSRQIPAFRHLADHPGMRNDIVFGEISKTTVPAVSAAILAAMERTGTSIPGLEELVLSFASHPDPELAATARAFLQARAASTICFEHLEDEEKRASWPAAFEVLAGIHRTSVVEGIVLLLERTRSAEIRALGFEALVKLYYDDSVNRRPWEGTPVADLFLRASLLDHRVDRAALLRLMTAAGVPAPAPATLVELGTSDLPLEAYAVNALGRFEEPLPAAARPWLETVVKSPERDPALRAQALGLLVRNGEQKDYRKQFEAVAEFIDFTDGSESGRLLIERWLARGDHAAQSGWLLEQSGAGDGNRAILAWVTLLHELKEEKLPAEVNAMILTRLEAILLGPAAGASPVLCALSRAGKETMDKVRARLTPGSRQALSVPSRGTKQQALPIAFADGDAPNLSSLGADQLLAIVEQSPPDSLAGRAIFRTLSCGDCHNVHGEGPSFGPDLATAARQRSKSDLIKAIISPASQVTPGYEATVFETSGGARLVGFIESRNELEIHLRDRVGNPFSISREAVKNEWHAGEGMMVCDAAASITAPEFASLLGYLATLAE